MIPLVRWKKQLQLSIGLSVAAVIFVSNPLAQAASAPQAPDTRSGVQVFASADEFSPVIEHNPAGNPLAPIAEMTAAGGMKWFMVKTKNGNVGWIKANDAAEVKKIDEHFRTMPRELRSVAPEAGAATSVSSRPGSGSITIPVKIYGPQVLVPVSFQNGSSTAAGYLVLDTGAMQTMISKRMARDLRLLSVDSQVRTGIGGSMVADVGVVDVVRVGNAGLRNMRVTIHDLPFGSEGLLGFDFLGRFHMSIDSDKQEMVLTPRKQ
jgi:hypothetical protein